MGNIYGYVRVSTQEQNEDRQIRQWRKRTCRRKIFMWTNSVLDSFRIPQNHIIWAAAALGYLVAEGAALKKKAGVIKYIR